MYSVNFKNCKTVEDLYATSLEQLAIGYTKAYPSYLPHIQELMSECKSYRELGTNQGCSTCAVVLTNPEYVELIDKSFERYNPQRVLIDDYSKNHNIKIVMHEESSLAVDTDVKTDFLLVDSVHKYKHVIQEIKIYEPLTNKFILFHDTVGFPGVGQAVSEFLDSTKAWKLHYHLDDPTAGYTVIKRITQ